MQIFRFENYKEFLRDHIARLPAGGRGEINRIGQALGVHPTLVSQVLRGSKEFNSEQAMALAGHLELSPAETDYLLLMVQYQRAGTSSLHKYYAEQVEEKRRQSTTIAKRIKQHRSLSDTERAIFYSHWHYSAIRLFTSIGDGQTLDAISRRFAISRTRAMEMTNFLVTSALCTEANGLFKMGTQHTHLPSGSPFLGRHHTNWRLRAIERFDDLSADELMFTSPFSISKKDFALIKELLLDVIRSTSKKIETSPAERLACLNIDLVFLE